MSPVVSCQPLAVPMTLAESEDSWLALERRDSLVQGMKYITISANANVVLHGLFTDNMVLQCGGPVYVYWTADDGEKVTVDKVTKAQHLGIGIIHQEIVLVPHLSVAKNIYLGREPKTKFGTVDYHKMMHESQQMVKKLGLQIDVNNPIAELTIAQQQMVEIVKAISFNTQILVMDEPTSSLSDEEVDKLFETIGTLKSHGVSIIYISHRSQNIKKAIESYFWKVDQNDKIIPEPDGHEPDTLAAIRYSIMRQKKDKFIFLD